MLLVFPFSVYTVYGFERLRLFDEGGVKMLAAVVLTFVVIGAGYSTGMFSYVGQVPNSYVPVNLVQSSIGWNQIDDVKNVLRWLDVHALTNSSVLSEERFYGWALIYLKRANSDVKVFVYLTNHSPQQVLERALSESFSGIYLIWFAHSSLENFKEIYSHINFSVYQYETNFLKVQGT